MIFSTLYISLQDTISNVAPADGLQLDGIMEPAPIPFSFDTIGWKVTFILLVLLLIYIVYKIYQHYKGQQYRRDAVQAIETMEQDGSLSESIFVSKVLFLIKQTALYTYQRIEVASLNGEEWLQFLDRKVDGVNFGRYQEEIESAIYKGELSPSANFNKDDFAQMSKKWIQKHA